MADNTSSESPYDRFGRTFNGFLADIGDLCGELGELAADRLNASVETSIHSLSNAAVIAAMSLAMGEGADTVIDHYKLTAAQVARLYSLAPVTGFASEPTPEDWEALYIKNLDFINYTPAL